jgi:hypothetical protein
MRIKTEAHPGRFREPNQNESIEPIPEEEEDALCNEYVVMSEQRHMPALQEYLDDLHAFQAFQ